LNGSFPVIDSSNGGMFTGMIAAADTALGMLDKRTRIVPGHGRPQAEPRAVKAERPANVTQ
jgi:hypothetical protein